jgi:O-antigen/teichoic acid export membrane protein
MFRQKTLQQSLNQKIIAFSNWNLWTFPLQFLLNFAASVYVVRTLGLTLYGRWNIILTSMTLFALLSDTGLASCVTKFYPELATEKARWLRTVFFLFLGRVLLLTLIAISMPFWPDSFSLSETAEDLSLGIMANVAIQIIASTIVGWHLARFDNKPIQIATALQNFLFPLSLLCFYQPHLVTLLFLYSAVNLIKTLYLMTTVRLNPRWFFQAVFTAKLPTDFAKRTGLQIQSKGDGQSFSPSSPSLIILSVAMMFCTYWSLAPKMLIAFEQHKFYDITSLLFTLLLGGIFFLAGTHHKFQLAFLSLCILRVLFHGALSFYVIRKYQIQREWDWLGKTLVCNILWLPPLFIKKIPPLGMGITLLSLSLLFLWAHKKMGVLTNQDKANFARLSLPFKDKILACL